jgi:hypothetical protein
MKLDEGVGMTGSGGVVSSGGGAARRGREGFAAGGGGVGLGFAALRRAGFLEAGFRALLLGFLAGLGRTLFRLLFIGPSSDSPQASGSTAPLQ